MTNVVTVAMLRLLPPDSYRWQAPRNDPVFCVEVQRAEALFCEVAGFLSPWRGSCAIEMIPVAGL